MTKIIQKERCRADTMDEYNLFSFPKFGSSGGTRAVRRNKTLWNGKNFSVMERKIIWKRELKNYAENDKGTTEISFRRAGKATERI